MAAGFFLLCLPICGRQPFRLLQLSRLGGLLELCRNLAGPRAGWNCLIALPPGVVAVAPPTGRRHGQASGDQRDLRPSPRERVWDGPAPALGRHVPSPVATAAAWYTREPIPIPSAH